MHSRDELKRILSEQREAILQRPCGIEREALSVIEERLPLPHVIVLTGIRRCGKSTLLRQLMRKEYNDKDFYYINFEDERLLTFKAAAFNELYEALLALYGEQRIFLIDEIQNVTGFEAFVRRFSDQGFKFIITGSNAQLLSRELGTKLTGRHVDINVKPFSFKEFTIMHGLTGKAVTTKERVTHRECFEEYLTKGGMPEYLLYKDPEILRRTYDDIVVKDVVARYRVEHPTQLRLLYQYLITNFARRFSYNSLKKFVGIKSVNTITKFIAYLEETYFASVVTQYSHSMKERALSQKKLYVVDNGFIPLITQTSVKERGWLLENLIYNHLREEGDVFFYAAENECDFVRLGEKPLAVQVSWELTNREREIKGCIAAMKELRIEEGLIITMDHEEVVPGKRKIRIVPAWKYLLEESQKF